MEPEDYMRLALDEVEIAVAEGNAPFAVVVVDSNNQVVLCEHDRVKEQMDPTAHGEVNAIRKLCGQFQTLSLEGYTFYTTSEPCPTCFSSMIKAHVSHSVYGAKTESTASLPISAEELAAKSLKHTISVRGGVLADVCLEQRSRLLAA